MSSQAIQVAFDAQRVQALACQLVEPPENSIGRIIPIFEEAHCGHAAILNVLAHRFSFNQEEYDLGEKIDWLTNPSDDIEWHILLHKFYYGPGLARWFCRTNDARYSHCFEELVRSWMDQTPVGFIAADVTARRIQNWIYAWRLFRQHDADCFSRQFEDEFLASVAEQTNYVCANLAPARNHRTLALYAVFLASVAIPDADDGSYWRALSVSELLKNIDSDLLDDGVHCELSTDYHHIVLRSYLLFFRLAEMHDIQLPQEAAEKVCRALDFAMHIHRPDGEIPALSDSDSRSFLELLHWGARLFGRSDYEFAASQGTKGFRPSEQHRIFPEGGYAILRSPWRNGERFSDARYLAFDCGEIGAGNHGHLDALNIEVAAFGRPLIVDPGRFTYDEQGKYNWRAHFRQTAAHNTVSVNRCDQAIYVQRGARRKIMAPRPTCRLVRHEFSGALAHLHAMVSSPNYSAIHHRNIWFFDNRYWVILDRLYAREEHEYELRYQLTPPAQDRVSYSEHDGGTEITSPGLSLLIAQLAPAVVEEQGFVSKTYGVREAAPRICAKAMAGNESFITVVYPTVSTRPQLDVHHTVKKCAIEVRHEKRNDTWEWHHKNAIMLHRNEDMARTWRLAKECCNGQ